MAENKIPTELSQNIENFDAHNLKHAETDEKNPLPSKEVVEQEKQEVALRESIEGFEKKKLHRANTVEKNPLPDAENVAAEKQHQGFVQGIEHFEKAQLRATSTQEKILFLIEIASKRLRIMRGVYKRSLISLRIN